MDRGKVMIPQKRITTLADMEQFAVSPARQRILCVIEHLANMSVGLEVPGNDYKISNESVQQISNYLTEFSELVDKIPPQQMKQRFGNPSYRVWFDEVHKHIKTGNEELDFYLQNAFGSHQRIDFGTGHELNFLAFFDGYIRVYSPETRFNGSDVLFVFAQYFRLCCKFIMSYNLEPAGSHGVWGLDDHFHIPFILGAAQLSQLSPTERPQPKDLLDPKFVEQYKSQNLYFAAIDFIFQTKKGPFFEHSPILYDVSGVKTMSKIKSGMIKMYIGEVLAKLQVMQHFYFGTLFPYESTGEVGK